MMAKRWLLGLLLLLFACDRARGGLLDDVFDFFSSGRSWVVNELELLPGARRAAPRKLGQSTASCLTF